MQNEKKKLVAEALLGLVEKAKSCGPVIKIGVMTSGSELGAEEVLTGARLAQEEHPSLRVVAIGPRIAGFDALEWIETPDCEADIAAAIAKAVESGVVSGAVAMHFPFPIGVTTIGRIMTPGRGKPMFIASCTGTSSVNRGEALLRNAIYGIATAKASGIAQPTVAFLNLDGANPALRALSRMKDNGYAVQFATSARGDGGSLLRGNDLISGAADVVVCDTLTGNVLIKLFATFTSGGQYETLGWGYGPSTGENWKYVVSIISRASGAPVIANTIALTARVASGGLPELVASELAAAKKAGLNEEIVALAPKAEVKAAAITAPAAVTVDAEIAGVDVLDMESAAQALWKEGIYAETAMGCTGPVVRIPAAMKEKSQGILKSAGFL